MTDELIAVQVLAARTIHRASQGLASQLKLPPGVRSLGLLAADCDDAVYCALDEATKQAAVTVVYGQSLHAGAAHAPSRYAGEVLGILAGPNPAEVTAGLEAAVDFLSAGVGFRWADGERGTAYFAHTVPRAGSYLAGVAGVKPGQPLAYLVAPPLESVVGVDEALKAADVALTAWFRPPSPTNYGGALLVGGQAACQAACAAFADAVKAIAAAPREV
ncbi:MAG: ethanolamine utilization microcompartment protein EutL [Oscillospiraceae bacterium]|nr:ethanolamine utilization microcompartment protein EutL [Oscillospiraceae bacterium]